MQTEIPIHISKDELKTAKPEYVKRLAQFLNLKIDGMTDKQIVRLVYWRLTRVDSSNV